MRARLLAHPRLLAAAATAILALAVLGVAAARSRPSASCAVPPPRPALPGSLRSLGDLDQPYDAADARTLKDAAQHAAAALHSDLAGQSLVIGDPVAVAAATAGGAAALVVPLGTNVAAGGGPPRNVEGLVSFLRDCAGHAYFSGVADLAASPPPAYPSVSRTEAARRLGANPDSLRLVYIDDPFHPLWDDGTGRRVDAEPLPPPGT